MLLSTDIEAALDSQDIGQSLLALRGFREQCLTELKDDIYTSDAGCLLEEIANQTESANSSYHKLKFKLAADDRYESCKKLKSFDRLCRRIARLEREALHYYVPPHLAAA